MRAPVRQRCGPFLFAAVVGICGRPPSQEPARRRASIVREAPGVAGRKGQSSVSAVNIADVSQWILLAQAQGAGDAAAEQSQQAPGFSSMLPALAVIMVMFYFLILRPQKAKDQQFRSMVENLKEKDRVVTIGGIHGVVTNVQRDAGLITIRVDESTGTKIKVGASAIAKVVTDEESAESPKSAS